MRTLVTGGAGFIGSNLVDWLVKEGHEVIVLDNLCTGRLSNLKKAKKKIKFIKIDIARNENNLHKFFKKVDWVFHMAGLADMLPSILNPNKYFYNNVLGTLNILNASKKAKVKKLIYAASASCYGITKKNPTSEKFGIDPQYPYALTKFLGEQLTINWAKLYSMGNVSLRFFNVYGPRLSTKSAYSSVFGIFLAQKLAEKPLTIVGDGKQTRDFIHVFDVVKAMIKAAKKGKPGKIYNVGSGKESSVNLIANIIGGRKVYVPKRPGETRRSLANISKIKKELNWKPKIKIKKGLEMLLSDISRWKEAKVWTVKKIKKDNKNWFKNLK